MSATKSMANTAALGYQHNHAHCIDEALGQAERVCEKAGERFTDLRRQVFELVWAGHTPVKAYDLMSELASKRSGVAPATVYRALDFLQAQGLVHKIESLNAYLGCAHPEKEHQGHFLICEHCETVRELDFASFRRSINRIATEQKFQIKRTTIELFGVCSRCQKTSVGPA